MLDRQSRQVRAKAVPNVKRETLQAEILKEIERCSKIYTDEWTGYDFQFPSLAFSCQSTYEILLFDPSKSRLFIQVVLAKKEWRPGTLNERMVLLAPGGLRHERRSFGWGAIFPPVLFVAKGDNRVDRRSPARRQVACSHSRK